MYELELLKPDGRRMTLYSRRPIPAGLRARSPAAEPVKADPHLRWHPLRSEWVAYAAHRQARTFQPPPQYDPLRASDDPLDETELPAGDYDIAVFDNLFPALSAGAHAPPATLVPSEAASGHCEVVVFTQNAAVSLSELSVDTIALLLEVWGRRTDAIIERVPDIQYVLPFENRGAEVGVTLHHAHGQIYAYTHLPPVPQRMHDAECAHLAATGRPLLESLIEAEISDGRRIIYVSEDAVAFVPAWARYPYEVWVAPRKRAENFASLTRATRLELSRALLTVLRKYDGLWGTQFPYIMAWYQTPHLEGYEGACHLHAEFFPPYRMRGRLKFLAGTEVAAGLFANDTLPEDKAAELQAVQIVLD
jgi:UDPglucose--hexose-1-phosphate uridylyltransferase